MTIAKALEQGADLAAGDALRATANIKWSDRIGPRSHRGRCEIARLLASGGARNSSSDRASSVALRDGGQDPAAHVGGDHGRSVAPYECAVEHRLASPGAGARRRPPRSAAGARTMHGAAARARSPRRPRPPRPVAGSLVARRVADRARRSSRRAIPRPGTGERRRRPPRGSGRPVAVAGVPPGAGRPACGSRRTAQRRRRARAASAAARRGSRAARAAASRPRRQISAVRRVGEARTEVHQPAVAEVDGDRLAGHVDTDDHVAVAREIGGRGAHEGRRLGDARRRSAASGGRRARRRRSRWRRRRARQGHRAEDRAPLSHPACSAIVTVCAGVEPRAAAGYQTCTGTRRGPEAPASGSTQGCRAAWSE